jgi:hydroxymethylpyrimidine/phosphomethylpyrimidine kinase
VLDDLDVGAMKTGMLANAAIIESVVRTLGSYPRIPLIVDPVMVATSGDALLDPDAVEAVKTVLLPRAALITPNIPEAARLLDAPAAQTETEMQHQARALGAFGAAVLLKGGHGEGSDAVDFLFIDGELVRLSTPRIETRNTHGTGCTLSAAIAALVARGVPLSEAVARAKTYVQSAIAAARDQRVGKGAGPVDHLYAQRNSPLPA